MSLMLKVNFLSIHNIFHFVSHYNKKVNPLLLKVK